MRSVNTELIILGYRPIGEADKLIFCYSKNFGKLRLVAKGARKIKSKFMGHLETLNIADAQIYFGPQNTLLTEINTLHNSKSIRNNIKKLESAFRIAEISEQTLFEKQVVPELYELLEECIKALKKSNKASIISIYYTYRILTLLGLCPNFKDTKAKIDKKFLNFFEFIKKTPLTEVLKIKLTAKEIKEINNFTKNLIQFQTDKNIKSLEFTLS